MSFPATIPALSGVDGPCPDSQTFRAVCPGSFVSQAQSQLCVLRAVVPTQLGREDTVPHLSTSRPRTSTEVIRSSHRSLHAQTEGFVPKALLVAESLTMSSDRTALHVSRKDPETRIM